jgi:succinyl-diaminopimelate desuccinylase
MKSAIAAFVTATASFTQEGHALVAHYRRRGRLCRGTPRIIDWLNEREIRPDMILIGERHPSTGWATRSRSGGGSVNMWIKVPGAGPRRLSPSGRQSRAQAGPGG